MLACHLLKAVEFWTDFGFGEYGLHYILTKQKKEVDFLISKDGRPWMLVECKSQSRKLSKTLVEFQQKLMVPYAFQVVFDASYEAIDCFGFKDQAVIVPARSFLSQLV